MIQRGFAHTLFTECCWSFHPRAMLYTIMFYVITCSFCEMKFDSCSISFFQTLCLYNVAGHTVYGCMCFFVMLTVQCKLAGELFYIPSASKVKLNIAYMSGSSVLQLYIYIVLRLTAVTEDIQWITAG